MNKQSILIKINIEYLKDSNLESIGNAPITFMTVDFYEYETSYSGLFGGLTPQYNFTSQYLVNADAFFVEHLQIGNNQLIIENKNDWKFWSKN